MELVITSFLAGYTAQFIVLVLAGVIGFLGFRGGE